MIEQMERNTIEFKVKTATKESILLHLKECNADFIPNLDEVIPLTEYSEKIAGKAVTFEAWENNVLIGLVAAYLNDSNHQAGFITNVSVIKSYAGKGIASELMNNCISFARKEQYAEIKLEVNKDNQQAIRLYKKLGFTDLGLKENTIQMKLTI